MKFCNLQQNHDTPEVLHNPNMPHAPDFPDFPDFPDSPDSTIMDFFIVFFWISVVCVVICALSYYFSESPKVELPWEALREKLSNKFLEENPDMISKELIERILNAWHEAFLVCKNVPGNKLPMNFETFWQHALDTQDFTTISIETLKFEKGSQLLGTLPMPKPPIIEESLSFPTAYQIKIFLLLHPTLVFVTLLIIGFICACIYVTYFERR